MNAQECRILTATCMHIIAWLTLYMFNIRSIMNYIPYTWTGYWYTTYPTYPAPKQASDTRVSDLRIGGRHLAMSLYKLKAILQLDYALESLCLFTLSLHWQLTSKAQNGNQSCSWGRCHKHRLASCNSCTRLLHWAGLNITTLPYATHTKECVLSL